ncbi:glycosyltransferase family 2 protein [Asticcacaulis solisilvae]|uniref:glycosyltransferase family 2 protein n=1 Tax=Asticcacaulis solisilvae TaxID=1217274 RepID=UPI003FD85582
MSHDSTQKPFACIVHAQLGEDLAPHVAAAPGRGLVIWWSEGAPVGRRWFEDHILWSAEPIFPVPPRLPPCPLPVSLVICTRDRPEALRRCLESLRDQVRAPDEVIVVDNASVTAETRAVAEAFGAVYVREDRPGLDIARNTGARTARFDLVAYTDDDTELHPLWLDQLCAGFTDGRIMAVTGLVLPARLDTEAQWLFERYFSFTRGFTPVRFDIAWFRRKHPPWCPAWEVGAGASMAFRREIFDKIGYFDERLDVGASGCSGDSEFWNRILAAGYDCLFQPTALLYHHHRADLPGLYRQIEGYMSGHTSSLLVQHERSRDTRNLWRVYFHLPVYLIGKLMGRIGRKWLIEDRILKLEIKGALAGVRYYHKARRP